MLNEPSVVAIDKNNGTILATGAEAKKCLAGRQMTLQQLDL